MMHNSHYSMALQSMNIMLCEYSKYLETFSSIMLCEHTKNTLFFFLHSLRIVKIEIKRRIDSHYIIHN